MNLHIVPCHVNTGALGYMLGMLLANAMEASDVGFDPRALIREAAQGHVDNVRAIARRFPGQVCLSVCSDIVND